MADLTQAALTTRPTAEIGRLRMRAFLFAAIGALIGVVAFVADEHASSVIMQSYLIGYIFWLGITLGSLAVLMIHHLTGGSWGLVSRRVLEASTRNLPLMALLFLPIAFNLETLYEWARPGADANHFIHEKAAYLNKPFFYIRAVIYFVIWFALAYILNHWSRQQDLQAPQPPGPADRRFRMVSGPGLVIYVITVTFMSVDWVMSLDPEWYSTIFGILTIGGQGLSTLAFTILVLAMLAKFQPISSVARPDDFHDLGKLMFAFILLWAYFSISQLLIIWSANLPEEIPFYLERLHGPWYPISVAVLIGHFVLPFLLLLSRERKRNYRRVARVAFFILVMRVVDIAWTIGPVFRHEGSGMHLLDFAVVMAMGAAWLFLFFTNLSGRALVPAHDPYLREALAHGGH
jgi:hypothetical protein